jgi:CRP/FNR family cyclic AMP-dependent transcriptional regulator
MTYERELTEKMLRGEGTEDNLDVSFLRYLWDASPLSFMTSKENYHDFFKNISFLNTFSDNEVRLFTKFLHRREFQKDEVVFKQGDTGYGLYFIFNGSVNILANYTAGQIEQGELVITLRKREYFGEMGLLEEYNRRTATAVAAENTILLGIFKPDLERMLELYPVLGAKFLRETALLMANRMGLLTREIVGLKKKLKELEFKK